MHEPSPLNSVAEFHRTFRHPVLQKPLIPSEDRCRLRLTLLEEELKELEDAVAVGDIVAVADAAVRHSICIVRVQCLSLG